MEIPFAKMHGAANDFVVVEESPPAPDIAARLSVALCDRRRGVGADGVLFLERLDRSREDDPVFRIHFRNRDGSRGEMCFNGSRCCALRAVGLGWATGTFSFLTGYGVIRARVDEAHKRVRLWFPPPRVVGDELELPAGSPARYAVAVDTGDPHLVVELEKEVFGDLDFEAAARPLRWWTEALPEGANIHMVWRGPREWRIRSFERGVEAETWACGSGCIATVAALAGLAPREEPVVLRTRGEDLIEVQPLPEEWTLEGPAVEVFRSTFRWEPKEAG